MTTKLGESVSAYSAHTTTFAERYAKIDTTPLIERFALWFERGLAGCHILDAGSGTGRDARLLLDRGAKVTGIDLAQGMVRYAASAVPDATFVHGDVRSLPFDCDFDGVWAMASLVHLSTDETLEALREFRRVTRPGGHLFVSVPNGSAPAWRTDDGVGRRWFRYFRDLDELRVMTTAAGWDVLWSEIEEAIAGTRRWLNLIATANREGDG